MFERLTSLFHPKDGFHIPRRRLPSCEIRPLLESDYASCEAIYRLNEAARFPAGYFPRFSDWLRNHRALILVAEVAGEIRGLGGINAEDRAGKHFAALSFGMVHPEHQRAGFGTTLLLARLALLASRNDRCTVMLSTVEGSETFYRRFGFRYLTSVPDQGGYAGDTYIVSLTVDDSRHCAATLSRARLMVTALNAPIPSFSNLSPMASILTTTGDASAATT
jgi:GNAT superfamily N-acetyltransferase